MKKYLSGLILLAFGAAWIAGCSKDNGLPPPQKAYYRPASIIEKDIGAIKGLLNPVPSYAIIYAKGDQGNFGNVKAAADGSFLISGLEPGRYILVINYEVNNAGYSYSTQYETGPIDVVGGETVSAGMINLPWTY